MKVLHLTLKKKWFDMIESGEKKEEYREIKPYWIRKLVNPRMMQDENIPEEKWLTSSQILTQELSNGYAIHLMMCPQGMATARTAQTGRENLKVSRFAKDVLNGEPKPVRSTS